MNGWGNVRATMSALAFTALASVMTTSHDAFSADPNPPVIPIDAHAHGMTYGEWAAKWWQWVFSIPQDVNPLLTDGNVDCSVGQSGSVWYLAGTFTTTPVEGGVLGQAERTCTIPTGKMLFIPIINAECSTAEGNGETEDALRGCANDLIDFVVPETLFVVVDDVPLDHLSAYRVDSPLFTYGPLPEDNILGFAEGTTSLAVAAGYHVMLPPLSAGGHTIHFGGVADFGPGSSFTLDITYHLTIDH